MRDSLAASANSLGEVEGAASCCGFTGAGLAGVLGTAELAVGDEALKATVSRDEISSLTSLTYVSSVTELAVCY